MATETVKAFRDKQPYEEYYNSFNFSRRLTASGETISSAVITVTDNQSSPTDVTATITDSAKQNIVGSKVNFWVRAGIDGHTYKVTCQIVTSASACHEWEGTMAVVER